MYRYMVRIQGHEPPFKWTLRRVEGASSPTTLSCGGEADSREEAMDAATEAAREFEDQRLEAKRAKEYQRKWEETVREVTVLEVEEDGRAINPLESALAELQRDTLVPPAES